jgi:cyanophycinase
VATAQRWFTSLGLDVVELPVLKRSQASLPHNVDLAQQGGFFYLSGGDPGLVVDVLHDTPVWNAMVERWQKGAALAGSSAGAMALGQWSLIRGQYRGDPTRRAKPALALVPKIAVAPHFERYGHRWVPSVLDKPPAEDVVILGIDERSAALWNGHGWTAHGPGEINIITSASRTTYASGASLPLSMPTLGDG